MKQVFNYIFLMFFSLLLFSARGQGVVDDTSDSLKTSTFNTPLDSTSKKMEILKGSIRKRLDSLKGKGQSSGKLQYQLDSLENLTSLDFKKLDDKLQKLNHTIDSLEVLHLPTDKYKGKFDSLSLALKQKRAYHKVDSLSGQWKKKIQNVSKAPDSLQAKLTKKEEALQQAIHKKTSFTDSLSLQLKNPVSDKELNFAADKMKLDGISSNVKLPGSNATTPGMGDGLNKEIGGVATTKDLSVSKVEMPNEMKNINTDASKLTQLPKSKMKELTTNTGFEGVKGDIQKVSSATGKIETYNKDLKNIASGNTEKVQALPKDIENAAMNQGQLKELNTEIKQAESTKNVLMQYQDAAAKMNEKGGKKAIADIAVKELPDYFAGQEEKLQAGIAKLEKLKRKYGSIPDSRYLPKHVPSDMKGKPLIERIVPGINFQFFQLSGLTLVDVSPFAMYRFTSRLRTGIGATYRLQFNSKVHPVHLHDAYGYRVMTDYKVFSGFSVHAEGEWMKITPYDPMTNVNFNDSQKKQWIPGLYLGILKQYKAGKHINGNFQVMYNFLYHHNGLYPNKINIRFGFEFPLKKKVKNVNNPPLKSERE